LAGSSLIPFHRVLIVAAIVFCAGFAWWLFSLAERSGSTIYGVLSAVFLVLAILLAIYLWNLRRVLGYSEDDQRD
jgi:lipopolysaccharide export LptBFGC system permease protein LptF